MVIWDDRQQEEFTHSSTNPKLLETLDSSSPSLKHSVFRNARPSLVNRQTEKRKTCWVYIIGNRSSCLFFLPCSFSHDHAAPHKDNFLPIYEIQSHKGHMEGALVAATGYDTVARIYGFLFCPWTPYFFYLQPAPQLPRGLYQVGWLNIIKMSRLTKLIQKYTWIPIEISSKLFTKLGKLMLKSIQKSKGPRMAKPVLKNKLWGPCHAG